MFNLVRKVVAGPKNKTQFQGSQLDLTYITQRIIAMAYPASHVLQKTYRNRIEDVVNYFNTKHGDNYLIINVSSRVYDYALFDMRVKDYQWPDHQSPPITTLIDIAYQMYRFLKGINKQDSERRVVAVHCNHGKGRTGTTIIAFLLLINYFQSAVQCLKFYNSKRFNKQTYGVDQPCQIRYLNYIQRLIKLPKINPKLICYRLKGISHKGLNCDYFVKIQLTRNQFTVFEKIDFGLNLDDPVILMADILIQIYLTSWTGSKRIARINTNLYFCDESLQMTFHGKDLKVNDHHSDFSITLHLQYFCLCHLPMYQDTVCKCKYERTIEEKYWGDMIGIIKKFRGITGEESDCLVNWRKIKVKTFKSKSRQRLKGKEEEDGIGRSMSSRKAQININFKFTEKGNNFKATERAFKEPIKPVLTPPSSSTLYSPNQKSQKIRKLSDEVEYYSDFYPIIKISKVQKIE